MIDLNMTLVAQILNFLILVALLRWLAYKPVVSMLKARENRIADSIQRADDDVVLVHFARRFRRVCVSGKL